jgi:hypothetical protein
VQVDDHVEAGGSKVVHQLDDRVLICGAADPGSVDAEPAVLVERNSYEVDVP